MSHATPDEIRKNMTSHFVKAGVAGVILRGNRIVLVRRKYGANRGKWCIPCGNVEVGEDVRTAVKREIGEETGLDVAVGDVLDVLSTHHSPEMSVVGVYFLVIEKGGDLVAGDDAAEVGLFPLENPPADMAFETDRKIIDKLNAGY
ncbi:MAG: NUDIX domain-containing protein [Gemmatimonadota bacterium]|nr:NUDIX domain-containing protein [Gemmatimonadota bacterium]